MIEADNTKHLWKVVLSYRYASDENRETLYVMAANIKDACNIALSEYDDISDGGNWPEGREPFILSAILETYYVLPFEAA